MSLFFKKTKQSNREKIKISPVQPAKNHDCVPFWRVFASSDSKTLAQDELLFLLSLLKSLEFGQSDDDGKNGEHNDNSDEWPHKIPDSLKRKFKFNSNANRMFFTPEFFSPLTRSRICWVLLPNELDATHVQMPLWALLTFQIRENVVR